ncbi:septum site-determining protein MinC [Leminorella grimontii]|uniref:Probable septum site-determining protein MinC n=1 Tax=Leminorella grimontii TaxID=82981 RepID=A0AAV5MZT2_9GAMM|nr:septum site-determining protein MinC [Leminorella grimontii]KFC96020.1 MinC family septum site-determining protein [Leminorella grimontii ATCC 33999 = DSM 5078]GKX54798.1 septum site-determining protein MinC [Leminorella grimontii]GKX58215.1 septum site-determining protein MinC [Leminorella grimontii]VFS58434.1 Septum site-determining protein MinC [Leminorella grimontii]
MSQSPVELKGSSFTLSVVHLHHSEPDVIREALTEKVKQAPAFLQNAPVVLNVATLEPGADWLALQRAVSEAGLRVVGVSGYQGDEQKQAIQSAGLPLLTEGKSPKASKAAAAAPIQPPLAKTQIIDKPIRTGQQIYARNSDLIVVSHVSAGAELIADGNIHVYGTMRGRALAGASGDSGCQIFCTQLAAELVSIAGQYWLSDRIPKEFYERSARLFLKSNILTIEPLN